MISDLLGPGRAYEALLEGNTAPVRFLVSDLLSVVPPEHRPDPYSRTSQRNKIVVLPIPNLFEMVENGDVQVTLGLLAEYLPLQTIGYIPSKDVDTRVSIPLAWIHRGLWDLEQAGIPIQRWLM